MTALAQRIRLGHFAISTRLALWFGLSMLLLLGGFVVFLYSAFHLGLHGDAEHLLEHDETGLLAAIELAEDAIEIDAARITGSVAYRGNDHGGYVRLLSADGEVLYRSSNFPQQDGLPVRLPTSGSRSLVALEWQGIPARSLYTPIHNERGSLAGWLEITRLDSEVHRALHRLDWLLAIGVVLGVLGAVVAGRFVARRALQPMVELTREANRIGPEDLGRRLPVAAGARDEITELAATLNDLFRRIDASLERERRFRADAAHEMFTPLAAIQSEIDVTLRRPRSGAEYERTIATLGVHVERLGAIVEDLLKLSQAEALELTDPQRTGLSARAHRALERFRSRAEEKQVDLESRIQPELFAEVRESDLDAVLDCLLDNALKYTPSGGLVSLTAEACENGVLVRIRDTGAGFDDRDQPHLFARFYRSDDPAVQRHRGSGLGLSIVKAIVQAYGGRIQATSHGKGKGSTFEVWFRAHAATNADSSEGISNRPNPAKGARLREDLERTVEKLTHQGVGAGLTRAPVADWREVRNAAAACGIGVTAPSRVVGETRRAGRSKGKREDP